MMLIDFWFATVPRIFYEVSLVTLLINGYSKSAKFINGQEIHSILSTDQQVTDS